VDFEDTYAVTARLESFHLLLAIVALTGLHLWQVNFVMAYLNSNIDIDVYIEQSKSFVKGRGDIIWKLWKTLYGTMQGGHN